MAVGESRRIFAGECNIVREHHVSPRTTVQGRNVRRLLARLGCDRRLAEMHDSQTPAWQDGGPERPCPVRWRHCCRQRSSSCS